jgi:FdhD protein
MAASIARSRAVRAWARGRGDIEERLVIEEPLEIRLDGAPLAVTLRTPGDDAELAAGFVFTEGLVREAAAIERVEPVLDGPLAERGNVVDVRLAASVAAAVRVTGRPSFITSACGVCGRGTLDAVRRRAPALAEGPVIPAALLGELPERLRALQPVFAETGGLHGAAAFDANGAVLSSFEDVGRHNAVDKVIGSGVLGRTLPWRGAILQVSGRAGFEIVLKAWIAGIPIVSSVSAPSDLALRLAEEAGMTLIGFAREGRFTVYAGRERVG